jgi:hypothetical protein
MLRFGPGCTISLDLYAITSHSTPGINLQSCPIKCVYKYTVTWNDTFSENVFKKIHFQLHMFMTAKVNQSLWSIHLILELAAYSIGTFWSTTRKYSGMLYMAVFSIFCITHPSGYFVKKQSSTILKSKLLFFQKLYFYSYIHFISSVAIVSGRSCFWDLTFYPAYHHVSPEGHTSSIEIHWCRCINLSIVASCSSCDSCYLQHKQ